MTNEERDLHPESELNEPSAGDSSSAAPTADFVPAEDLRYAPPELQPRAAEASADSYDMSDGGSLDIEAALAAVSSLSDMVAEREAAEQARIARAEAEAQAKAEALDRVRHPERYFPVPPRMILQRGKMTSVVPGLVLVALGTWLTFSYTTQNAPTMDLLLAALAGGFGLILFTRWLGSQRWSQGALFFSLTLLLLCGALLAMTLFPGGIGAGWPLLLAAPGLAIVLVGFLSRPAQRSLFFPGLVLLVAGVSGLVVTLGAAPADVLAVLSPWWPVPVAVLALLLVLPRFSRRRP